MKMYNNEDFGKIIIVRNMIFHDSYSNARTVDHAWKKGRPCLILYSDDDFDYVVPITHQIKNRIFSYHYFPLDKSKISYLVKCGYNVYNINDNDKIATSAINLQTVYKIPIFGHFEIAKITSSAYDDLISQLYKIHNIDNLDILSTGRQLILKKY